MMATVDRPISDDVSACSILETIMDIGLGLYETDGDELIDGDELMDGKDDGIGVGA